MIADGQVSMGDVVFKSNVQKVRRFGGTDEEEGQIVAGFAGGTADALTLFERLEARLEEFPGQLTRAATSLARDWRTDKYLRRLEATMVVTDGSNAYLISGGGDVMNAEGGLIGIGSGGFYALAAARALATCEESSNLQIEEIAQRAMTVAADLCVYTNHNFVMVSISTAGRLDTTGSLCPLLSSSVLRACPRCRFAPCVVCVLRAETCDGAACSATSGS